MRELLLNAGEMSDLRHESLQTMQRGGSQQ
jgi:hypothetical protein